MTLKQVPLIACCIFIQCTVSGSTESDADIKTHSNPIQRVEIGDFRSRGLWTEAAGLAPAILMLPGSGPQGPEEMMPASLSANGEDTAVFNQLAQPFIDQGFHVLQLGKPGVDFFKGWPTRFYNDDLINNLTWNDLLENAKAGIAFLKSNPLVDQNKIYILGHSEGTQVAVDVVQTESDIKGLVLLGYSARSLIATVRWQLYERVIEHFVKTDVDANKDGLVTREEAEAWPEFHWTFTEGQTSVDIETIRNTIASDPRLAEFLETMQSSRYCQDGHCDRPELYDATLTFAGDLYVFTGEKDLQTVAGEALTLKQKCNEAQRSNCHVEIIPGVQHSFNLAKPPRRHPLLDIAVAPVEQSFLNRLRRLALQMNNGH